MTSSLITQIGFYPLNQPGNFTVGIPNPVGQPLRVQTQRADGAGENVTGSGQTVFIQVTTNSPTGRFDTNPSGAFSTSSIFVTVTNGRQLSQDLYFRDTTPGTVVFTATVTSVANTGLTFGETATLTKSVLPVGVGRLSFGTQPSTTDKEAAMSPVTVRVEDAAGNLDLASTRSVSLSIGNDPSGAALSGTTTVAAVNGIATFSDLNINRAGIGYTLVARSELPEPALTNAESQPFDINKLAQSIDFDELEDRIYGDDDLELIASSSSGLEVAFHSLTDETCTVDGNRASIVGAGVCWIRASLSGDDDHEPADDVDRSFVVNKADAKIMVEPYSVTYNGEPHASTVLSIIGVKGETGPEVGTVDLSGTVHTNAGSYANDVWTFAGNANYNDASGTVDNVIDKAPVSAAAGSGSAIFDGEIKTPTQCAIYGPGFVGDISCTNDQESVGPNAGSYTILPIVNGTGLSNFEIEKINGTFTIEKAATVTAVSFEEGPFVYRGFSFSAIARVSGPGGLDQEVPVHYSGDCINVSIAGGCTAAAVFAENANYFGSIGSSSITITKRPLIVIASSHVVIFGDPVPTVSPIFDGFVAGETSTVIDVLPTCVTSYTQGSPVGTYSTTCSDGHDNNYIFNEPYEAGDLIVNSACSSFDGFLSPIGGANSSSVKSGTGGSFNMPLRTFKLNSTIPFKFTAVCFGASLTTGLQTLTARKYSDGVPVGDEVINLADDGSTSENHFRFSNGQWHFNLKTKDLGDGAHGTWLFEARLFDGSRYSVWLAIRK